LRLDFRAATCDCFPRSGAYLAAPNPFARADMAVTTDNPMIESPCVKVCVMDAGTRLCLGCNRRIEEIIRWQEMTTDERTRIMSELPTRVCPARAMD
jgi:predicted Fe-S protein YdhL (DUF1289 family)